jgi:hypothetical protein
LGLSENATAGAALARSDGYLSDGSVIGGRPAFWQWARSPSGVWVEIAPSAIAAVFALEERVRRSLQTRLFAIVDLASVHPVPGPAQNLIFAGDSFEVRYSLDLQAKRVTIEGIEAPGRSNLNLAS